MKKKLLFSLICLLIIFSIGQVSLAAIEIIPSKDGTGKDQMVNTTVSNSYMLCQQMKDKGGSLYGTTVQPHLATNKDWGAVSYLSNSIYGTNTTGKNTGLQVTIDNVEYYSTTTNITGVMNWGSNPNESGVYTHTAGLLSTVTSPSEYITELYTNKDTKYVDLKGTAYSTTGMAMDETMQFYSSLYKLSTSTAFPVSARYGLFGIFWGNDSDYRRDVSKGTAASNITFRPVIWN